MSGYNATSTTSLAVGLGALSLTTQSALSYVPGERVLLLYAVDSSVNMAGPIISYNPINGSMLVNIDTISGIYGLQPIFNTQQWGETNEFFSPWNLSLQGAVAASTATVVPTVTVRVLDPGDPQRGQGLSNFVSDTEAIAQIIGTRLQLLQGEWFENLNTGTPLFQSLLGHPTTLQAIALILRQRILGTPYVTGISSFSINNVGRSFTFTAIVQTQFGAPITVTNLGQ